MISACNWLGLRTAQLGNGDNSCKFPVMQWVYNIPVIRERSEEIDRFVIPFILISGDGYHGHHAVAFVESRKWIEDLQ